MNTNLKDKVVLITGATGGIGKEVVRAFAAEGAKIALTSRTQANTVRCSFGSPASCCSKLVRYRSTFSFKASQKRETSVRKVEDSRALILMHQPPCPAAGRCLACVSARRELKFTSYWGCIRKSKPSGNASYALAAAWPAWSPRSTWLTAGLT